MLIVLFKQIYLKVKNVIKIMQRCICINEVIDYKGDNIVGV